ncbi:uncharacterized protein LOC130447103 [Diorhabda sublineata]|uniref:uncharacterized protein LOC130447103 n=1 Tax=Diorhabda sublineata TaxID=1163346 RepID=UPI0024E084B0|nr:uncharacterized protein LOC130447103 [Diorhabda sublineata]
MTAMKSTSALLHMFAEGSFRSSDEIKMADYAINCKIVFENEHITNEDLQLYKLLQRVIDAVRIEYENDEFSTMVNREEIFRHFSTLLVEYEHFMKFGENEREVDQLNIVERRIIFAFKRRKDYVPFITWLQVSLHDVINYVIHSFDETDRIGIVIKHEYQRDTIATFPIRFKSDVINATSPENFSLQAFQINGSFPEEEKMTLQIVRLKLPNPHKLLKRQYIPNWNYNDLVYL